jgi:hypothetical protein
MKLVEHGVNALGGHDPERICKPFVKCLRGISLESDLWGDGKASEGNGVDSL